MKKLILTEVYVLLAGTVFAWGNFSLELYSWLNQKSCLVSCTASQVANPFLTPCFFGAIFFTIAFIISVLIYNKYKSASNCQC